MMRIAQVAPLFESVPPKLYGGTERIVFNLTEAMVSAGHDVTLFASGDSQTRARLVGFGQQGLRFSGVRESMAPHLLMLEKVKEMSGEFDIIHFHNEYLHFSLARQLKVATLSTLHGRLDLPEYVELFDEFSELPVVSISDNQANAAPNLNWQSTVYHGLERDRLPFNANPGKYLAFLGRISPEKGAEVAIEIARRSSMKLKIAAKIENPSNPYVQSVIAHFDEPFVEYIGEIGDSEKAQFLGEAAALLFPITWPEPFGLVVIEAFATGTPVIAYRAGSIPELIRQGETGFIVSTIDEAVSCVDRLKQINREDCRNEFLKRFTRERMADNYIEIYKRLIQAREFSAAWHERHPAVAGTKSVETAIGGYN